MKQWVDTHCHNNFIRIIFLPVLILVVVTGVYADDIWVEDVSGCHGDTIEVEVWVDNATTSIDAFTFYLSYDDNMLAFVSCSVGTLNPGWVSFGCDEIYWDTVWGYGHTLSTSIPQGSYGSLIILTFDVDCPGCVTTDSSLLEFTWLADDLENFSSESGTFSHNCNAPTLTPSPAPTSTFTPDHTPTVMQTSTQTPTSTEPPTATPSYTSMPGTATPTPPPIVIPATSPGGLSLLLIFMGGMLGIGAYRKSNHPAK